MGGGQFSFVRPLEYACVLSISLLRVRKLESELIRVKPKQLDILQCRKKFTS